MPGPQYGDDSRRVEVLLVPAETLTTLLWSPASGSGTPAWTSWQLELG